jgi:hypothetical protein
MSERMNGEEYEVKMTELLDGLPSEFQMFLRAEAYDRGHSGGYEEVYNYAVGMEYGLRKALTDYQDRLAKIRDARNFG